MKNGGARPGAGRPKGIKGPRAIAADKAREYIIKRVSEELAPIMDKAIEQAKQGDQASRKELMDRAYGKAKESLELTGVKKLLVDF